MDIFILLKLKTHNCDLECNSLSLKYKKAENVPAFLYKLLNNNYFLEKTLPD